MAENITRCPKCETSFRIPDALLKTAKGTVRCGSCLHIFNAKEHLIEFATEQAPAAESAPQTEQLISDEMDSTRQPDDKDELNEELFGKNNTGEFEFNLFEREDDVEEEEDVTPSDESWALDLLENDDEDDPKHTPERAAPEPQDQEAREEQISNEEFDETYYSNSFQIIGEDSHKSAEHDAIHDDIAKDVFADDMDHETDDYGDDAPSSSKYLDSIEPEPVEFDWQKHSNIWHSKSLWTGLVVIAGLLLIAQIAWLKFDTLSTQSPYRSYYAKACSLLSCTLPELIDRSKIRTANLVVRSHPRVKNALIVDAVLQNTAKFEQTFPTLDLVFTDSQDKTVAARRLTPNDYLGGELAGRRNMPIKQPVHIAIEISDPGEQAVGYKISIAN